MRRERPGDLPRTIPFYTDARAWGGAEVYMTQLVCGLRRAGYETPLFVADWRDADAWVAHLEELGFTVTRYHRGKEYSLRMFLDSLRLLRGYEFVHFNKTHPRNSLPAVLAARFAGVRAVVTTEHLAIRPDSHVPLGRFLITSLVRLSNLPVDRTIAVSELSRQMLIDHYRIPPDRILAIRNGIEIENSDAEHDIGSTRADLGLKPGDVAGVLVGRLVSRKGHSTSLQALPEVLARVPDFKLIFAGDGDIEEELRAEAEALGVEQHVVWAGFRRDIPAILASVDLLILPSEAECLPYVILEAMGARLPVVAADVGGISEQIDDGVTGRLIRPRDPSGLASAMLEILGRPDRGKAMGQAGRAKLEREFSVDACVNAVLDVYEDVWAVRGGGAS